ncbi:MAG: hypothetical protein IM600_18520 [Bacteroidetes bacterium]|nr:hypothetical protein [Bacteroidota bacterium]
METQLLINKLSIVKQIIEGPHSDLEWGIDKLDSIIAELESELRQPDVIKSVCQCRKDLPNGNVELCDKCYPTDKA